MNFKSIAKIENSASLLTGMKSIIFAYIGAGIWSIAFISVTVVILKVCNVNYVFQLVCWLLLDVVANSLDLSIFVFVLI